MKLKSITPLAPAGEEEVATLAPPPPAPPTPPAPLPLEAWTAEVRAARFAKFEPISAVQYAALARKIENDGRSALMRAEKNGVAIREAGKASGFDSVAVKKILSRLDKAGDISQEERGALDGAREYVLSWALRQPGALESVARALAAHCPHIRHAADAHDAALAAAYAELAASEVMSRAAAIPAGG